MVRSDIVGIFIEDLDTSSKTIIVDFIDFFIYGSESVG